MPRRIVALALALLAASRAERVAVRPGAAAADDTHGSGDGVGSSGQAHGGAAARPGRHKVGGKLATTLLAAMARGSLGQAQLQARDAARGHGGGQAGLRNFAHEDRGIGEDGGAIIIEDASDEHAMLRGKPLFDVDMSEEAQAESIELLQQLLDEGAGKGAAGYGGTTDDRSLMEEALRDDRIDNSVRLYALKLLFEASGPYFVTHQEKGVVPKATLLSGVIFFLSYAEPSTGLQMLGFRAKGAKEVVQGSVAAAIQSIFPVVGKGTWFAWAQGMGETGPLWLPQTGAAFPRVGTWPALGRRPMPIASDWQLFNVALEAGLFDDKLRGMLAGDGRRS